MLLRNVLAAQLLPVRCGGHGLPAVLIDAENQCDVWLLAKVLQAWGLGHLGGWIHVDSIHQVVNVNDPGILHDITGLYYAM